MSTLSRPEGHSATVELYLNVQGQRLEVAQAGTDFLILREPFDLAEGSDGVLGVVVDGELLERRVFFFERISKAKRRASFF